MKLDTTKVETSLNQKILKVEDKISTVEINLRKDTVAYIYNNCNCTFERLYTRTVSVKYKNLLLNVARLIFSY